jgi:hypothetical protein
MARALRAAGRLLRCGVLLDRREALDFAISLVAPKQNGTPDGVLP